MISRFSSISKNIPLCRFGFLLAQINGFGANGVRPGWELGAGSRAATGDRRQGKITAAARAHWPGHWPLTAGESTTSG